MRAKECRRKLYPVFRVKISVTHTTELQTHIRLSSNLTSTLGKIGLKKAPGKGF